MRVLTPEEISELTTNYCGEKRVSLTSLLLNEENEREVPFGSNEFEHKGDQAPEKTQMAKILPFGSIDKGEAYDGGGAYEWAAGPRVSELFSCSLKIASGQGGVLFEESSVEVIPVKQKKAASMFILEEKEKLSLSRKKLESREVLKTYQKISSVDLEVEKEHQEDFGWSSSHGLLINKKQA